VQATCPAAGIAASIIGSYFGVQLWIDGAVTRSQDRIGNDRIETGRGSPGRFRLVERSAVFRYCAFFACSENIAPCGSVAFTIQSPPGTSIGPLRICPPFALTRSTAALMSETLK
jgi:hypothetical protein